MRLIGGRLKGRRLIAPKGQATRPTGDRLRESVFNVLVHGLGVSFAGYRVLDLFCGSGALGLEALSRGASQAVLIDNSAAAVRAARHNVTRLDETARARVLKLDATRLPAPPDGARADLAFLDPPYEKDLVVPALQSLTAERWLRSGALLVVETSAAEQLPSIANLVVLRERVYGAAKLTYLRAETI